MNILHTLWTKAVDTPDYDKVEWRQLEKELLGISQEEIQRLREALGFYARKEHLIIHNLEHWESASGEPDNLLCHPDDLPIMVEDGTVARQAIQGGTGWRLVKVS